MKDKIDQYIDKVKNLPPSPTLMIELISLLKKPDRDIDQLVNLLSHDLAVTAEILKLCNSAFFGRNEPATDMFEATFRLGFHEVYRVAIALSGSRTLRWWAAYQGLNLASLWEHSALTAISAQILAKELRESEAVAFTAGLLHDVGKVVIACAEGATYARLIREAGTEASLTKAETAKFGFNHCEIGSRLLTRWQVPNEIVGPIQFHHSPEGAGDYERPAAILLLANTMAYRLSESSTSLRRKPRDAEHSLRVLAIQPERLTALGLRAKEDAGRIKELFRTQSPGG